MGASGGGKAPAFPLPGPPVSEGNIVFGEPQHYGPVRAAEPVALAVEAVVASETMVIEPLRLRTAAAIVTGKPFEAGFAAELDVVVLLTKEGERRCIQRGSKVYTPPQDETGAIFPTTCLIDRDGDGRFEIARFHPYLPSRSAPRDVAIAPLALHPAPLGTHPSQIVLATRRLRVAALAAARAEIVLEHGISETLAPEAMTFKIAPEGRIWIPLQAGASATLGGLDLRVDKSDGGWRVTAAGAFPAWLTREKSDNVLRVGPLELPAREF